MFPISGLGFLWKLNYTVDALYFELETKETLKSNIKLHMRVAQLAHFYFSIRLSQYMCGYSLSSHWLCFSFVHWFPICKSIILFRWVMGPYQHWGHHNSIFCRIILLYLLSGMYSSGLCLMFGYLPTTTTFSVPLIESRNIQKGRVWTNSCLVSITVSTLVCDLCIVHVLFSFWNSCIYKCLYWAPSCGQTTHSAAW